MSGNGLTEGFWDSFSPLYSDLAQGDIPLKVVDILFKEGILRPDDSVLEVGCGKGAYSMLIKLYAKDDRHLMELLNSKIQEIPGVANTETLTALDQRFSRTLPIG